PTPALSGLCTCTRRIFGRPGIRCRTWPWMARCRFAGSPVIDPCCPTLPARAIADTARTPAMTGAITVLRTGRATGPPPPRIRRGGGSRPPPPPHAPKSEPLRVDARQGGRGGEDQTPAGGVGAAAPAHVHSAPGRQKQRGAARG